MTAEEELVTAEEWRAILKKYIRLVCEYEGISYLYPRDWSPQEYAVIEELESEITLDHAGR